jgi:hypothetical protein
MTADTDAQQSIHDNRNTTTGNGQTICAPKIPTTDAWQSITNHNDRQTDKASTQCLYNLLIYQNNHCQFGKEQKMLSNIEKIGEISNIYRGLETAFLTVF